MEVDYSEAIKNLVAQHYSHGLSVGEYRTQRRQLIDQMDCEYNGVKSIPQELPQDVETSPDSSSE